MATLASLRRYLEAGQVIGQLARARAEDLWSDLLGGEDPRGYGEEWLGDVLERSRRSGAQVINALSGEVRRQVDGVRLGGVEDLAGLFDWLREWSAGGTPGEHDQAAPGRDQAPADQGSAQQPADQAQAPADQGQVPADQGQAPADQGPGAKPARKARPRAQGPRATRPTGSGDPDRGTGSGRRGPAPEG